MEKREVLPLVTWRGQRGLTQARLAHLTGVSANRISDLECRRIRRLPPVDARAIAQALGCAPWEVAELRRTICPPGPLLDTTAPRG
jgi:transcriptional regulator with XRE-family HTH domain